MNNPFATASNIWPFFHSRLSVATTLTAISSEPLWRFLAGSPVKTGDESVSNGVSYTNSTENQLTKDGTWTYTYDNEGSLTQKTKGTNLDTWNYGYDNLNRLTSATEINAGATVQQLTFKYDVFGNRIDFEVTINGVTTATHFAYDGDNAWADFNGGNALQTRRLYTDATDALVARISSGGTVAWYLTDRLGSVRDIANNSTGVSIDHLDYDGFGNVSNETNTGNGDRYKFTAREFDSQTGLQYNRARYYDPKPGRWTSQDPIGLAGDVNLYRYVYDNPLNNIDAYGELGYVPTFYVNPLYGWKNNPDPFSVQQGDYDDCGILAPLLALAYRRPKELKSLITSNGDGAYFVKLYASAWRPGYKTNGPHKGETYLDAVDKKIKIWVPPSDLRRGYSGSSDGLWVFVVEVAYGKLRCPLDPYTRLKAGS